MPFRDSLPDPGFTAYDSSPPEQLAASGTGLSIGGILGTIGSAAGSVAHSFTPEGAGEVGRGIETDVGAAFRLDNDVVNAIQMGTRPTFTPDTTFNLPAKLKEDGMWDEYRGNFIGVQSQAEYNFVKQKINQEEQDKQTLASAGIGGMLASVAAGLASPTMLLPFVGEARGAAAVGRGIAMGLIASSIQEAPLRVNQYTRSFADDAESVAMSGVLGGVLGGAAAYLRGPGTVAEKLERTGAEYERMAQTPGIGAIPQPASAGAEAAERIVPGGLAPAVPGLRIGDLDMTLPHEGVLGANAADRSSLAGADPVARTLSQPEFAEGRYIMSQLSDGGLELDVNREGRSATSGGTVESNLSAGWGPIAQFAHDLDGAYEHYVFEEQKPAFAGVRASIAGALPGRTFMSKNEFRAAVTDALMNGDEHVVPEVAELAKQARRTILDPLYKEGLAQGVFVDPEKSVNGDRSYMIRKYATEVILRRQAEFEQILSDHIEDKLSTEFQDRFNKLKAQMSRRQEQIEDLQRPPEEVEALKEEFKNELRALDEATRGTPVEDLEAQINDLRAQAREARASRSNSVNPDDLLAQARDLEQQAGEPLQKVRAGRAALRRRLASLSKSVVAYTARQQAKLDAITRIEDQNLASLQRLALKGQKVLNDLDSVDDKALDQELSDLRTEFAKASARLDKGEDRIAKLDEDAFYGPQEAEGSAAPDKLATAQARQLKAHLALDRASEALEHADTLDRDELRGVIQEGLDAAASDTNALVSRRAVRAAKLEQDAAKLDPALVQERIANMGKELRIRERDFFEKAREGGADSIDSTTGRADFHNHAAQLASDITHKILGTYRRLPGYDMLMGPRGSELARMLDIASSKLVTHDGVPFIEKNVEKLLNSYYETLAPDIEITKRLGPFSRDTVKNPAFVRLTEEKDAKVRQLQESMREKGASQQEIDKATGVLNKKFARVQTDIGVVLQRLRYERGIPANPAGFAARAGHVIMNLNAATKLGGVVVASLPDIGRPIMKYGLLHTYRNAWIPYLKGFANLEETHKFTTREMHLAGVAIENVNHARAHDLWNVNDYMVRGSKFEKGLDYATSKLGAVALFDHWTNAMKQIAALAVNAHAMNALKDVVENNGGRLASQQFLARSGIDDGLAREIWNEVSKEGGANEVNGQLWPNTDAWENRRAIAAYRQMLVKGANDTIITPGVARPNMMDVNLLTKLIFQFKSFGMASLNKTMLAGLQQRDMGVLTGSLVSLAMGALSYYIYAKAAGGKIETQMQNELKTGNWERFTDEAINRSGLIGAFANVQDTLSDIPLTAPYVTFAGHQTARRNESNLIESIAGPTMDMVNNFNEIAQSSVKLAAGDPETLKRDLHRLRVSVLPFQNHFLFRRALDQVIP